LLSDIPEKRDFGFPDHCYFDPHSPQSIAQAFQRALNDPKAFVVDARRYLTWGAVAERTLDIYRQIAPCNGSRVERADVLASVS
jgi:hypothetical protein